MENKIELTIAQKSGKVGVIYKQDISGQCIKNGIIDLIIAAKEADLESDEFIACYAMLTAEIKKEKEIANENVIK